MADKCPQCGKPPAPAFKPFCSKRCADIDLGAWLKGGYAIAGAPINPENSAETDPQED